MQGERRSRSPGAAPGPCSLPRPVAVASPEGPLPARNARLRGPAMRCLCGCDPRGAPGHSVAPRGSGACVLLSEVQEVFSLVFI